MPIHRFDHLCSVSFHLLTTWFLVDTLYSIRVSIYPEISPSWTQALGTYILDTIAALFSLPVPDNVNCDDDDDDDDWVG